MTVKSEPLTKERKQSAIVTRATLDRQRGAFERISAFGVLFFSFAGSIAALSGGWPALRADPHLAPIVGGIVIQAVLTISEWWYGGGRGRWRYRLALLLDMALTTIGYGPLIVPYLAAYLAARGLPYAEPLAWLAVAMLSFVIAYYPERMLID